MIYTSVGKFASVEAVGNTTAETSNAAEKTKFRSETDLEAAINAAMGRMCKAPTREEKMAEWREMCWLIDQRTPSRRRFMARTQGLA
jgi:hypothetical protein